MAASPDREPLRVVLAPVYADNPYVVQLRDGLRERGVEVHRAGPLDGTAPLDRVLKKREPHVLHMQWLHQFCVEPDLRASKERAAGFLKIVRRARKHGTRLVWTMHNLVNHERLHPSVEWGVQRRLARMADGVIVHARSSGARAKRHLLLPRMPLRVIPHANYIDAYPNDVAPAAARAELGIDEDAFVLLFFGRIRGYKGLEELFGAFDRARKPAGSRLLVVGHVGDDEAEARLRSQADATPGVVFVPGYADGDRIQVYMNAADAVVLPYRKILTSGAALLAMSFGRAVVAPRRGDFPEVVGDEGGVLYSPYPWDGLRRGIERAAAARDQLAAAGARNLERARAWSASSVVDAHLALYEEVTGRSGAGVRSRTAGSGGASGP